MFCPLRFTKADYRHFLPLQKDLEKYLLHKSYNKLVVSVAGQFEYVFDWRFVKFVGVASEVDVDRCRTFELHKFNDHLDQYLNYYIIENYQMPNNHLGQLSNFDTILTILKLDHTSQLKELLVLQNFYLQCF